MGGQQPLGSFPPEVLEGFAGYSESHITWLLFVLHLNTFMLIKCGKIPLGLGLKGKRLIFFSQLLFFFLTGNKNVPLNVVVALGSLTHDSFGYQLVILILGF